MKHSVLDAEELAVGKREEVPVCVWGGSQETCSATLEATNTAKLRKLPH